MLGVLWLVVLSSSTGRFRLSVTPEALITKARALEEELKCGIEPVLLDDDDLSYLSLLAYRYCLLKNKLKLEVTSWGLGKSTLTTISALIGASEDSDFSKALGYADPTDSEDGASDSLIGSFNPAVWVANVGQGVTEATAADVFSCSVAIVAAYEAYKSHRRPAINGETNCVGGACGLQWLKFLNSYDPSCDITSTTDRKNCAMPGWDANPFLKMIQNDDGCPKEILEYLSSHERTAVYWVDFVKMVVESVKQNTAVMAMVAFHLYGNTFLDIIEAHQGGFLGVIVTDSQLAEHCLAFMRPVQKHVLDDKRLPPAYKLASYEMGTVPANSDDGL